MSSASRTLPSEPVGMSSKRQTTHSSKFSKSLTSFLSNSVDNEPFPCTLPLATEEFERCPLRESI